MYLKNNMSSSYLNNAFGAEKASFFVQIDTFLAQKLI